MTSFVVPFPSIYPVTWTWDATTARGTARSSASPTSRAPVSASRRKNVVVMYVNYVNGIGTENSYADLQGSGTADVFTDGSEIMGTWSRGPSMADIIQYKTASGTTIASRRARPGSSCSTSARRSRSRSNESLESLERRLHRLAFVSWECPSLWTKSAQGVVVAERLGDPRAAVRPPRGRSATRSATKWCHAIDLVLHELDDHVVGDVGSADSSCCIENVAPRKSRSGARRTWRSEPEPSMSDVLAGVGENVEDRGCRRVDAFA